MPLSGSFKGFTSLIRAGQALATSSSKPSPAQLGFPVGIDFGSGSLKVLHLQSGEMPSLAAAASVETPDELRHDASKRLAFQTQALPGLIRKMGLKSRRVACAIPAWATVCKHMQLTRTESPGGLAEQVLAQIPSALSCDASTISYKFLEITAQGSAKPEVIIIAVSRELVSLLMGAIRDAKLEPVGMHSEFAAVLGAFDYVHRRLGDEETNTLYLDIGYGTTSVAISHGRQLAFARVIDVGGGAIDEALAQQLGCSANDAHTHRLANCDGVPAASMAAQADPRRIGKVPELLNVDIDRRGATPPLGLSEPIHTFALREADATGADLTESLETLTDEVKMCLRFHAGQFPARKVQRIIFVGGESRDRSMCQQVARTLKIPAYIADPFGRFTKPAQAAAANTRSNLAHSVQIDLTRPQPGWAVALGLCVCPTDL